MKTLVKRKSSLGSLLQRKPFFVKDDRDGLASTSSENGFFSPSFGQAKFIVGKNNDTYEKEADTVAEGIVSGKKDAPLGSFSAVSTTSKQQKKSGTHIAKRISRLPSSRNLINKKDNEITKSTNEDSSAETLQPKLKNGTSKNSPTVATENLENGIKNKTGQGTPLDVKTKFKMESGFGADFSGVRVHTDSRSESMNDQLGSKAFTTGNNIFFNKGNFNPASKDGQSLLAHELTHTIQQGDSKPKEGEQQVSKETNAEQLAGNTLGQKDETTEGPKENTAEKKSGDKAKLEEKEKIRDKKTKKGDKKGGPVTGAESQGATTPRSPEDDPNFQQLKNRARTTANRQRDHESSSASASAAQSAALSPDNERESMAQSGQVDDMDNAEAGEFNAADFKSQLMSRIESMQLPATQEEAVDFDNNNNIDEVSSSATQDVQNEQANAAGPIETTSQQVPNTEAIPEREVSPLPEPPVGNRPPSIHPERAMPPKRNNQEVNQPLHDNLAEVDKEMADNQITEEQLANSNEPTFMSSLDAKSKAKDHTDSAPQSLRQEEQGILENAQINATTTGQAGLEGMHQDRSGVLNHVTGQQQQTGSTDSAERARIASEINTIYETVKTDVETILGDLDTQVNTLFTSGAEAAKAKFEAHVKSKMDAYKERRYSGLIGAGRWVKDKFMGLPDEVNEYFTEGRQVYIDHMDTVITEVAQLVADKLNEAKQRITTGKQEVQNYVTSLPENLQRIGGEAAEAISTKFDELEESVNNKQSELIDSLARQYSEGLEAVDARIEEMKAANRGLIDKALDAVVGVIKTILKIKDMLTNLLMGAVSVIGSIIKDPIGFLKNLISGISQGFINFGSNILQHLQSGFIGWLTGALGPIGITIPDDLFSLRGIFSLVAQVLGITWDYIRLKAVKLLGEPVVTALETGFEVFQILRTQGIAGLWEFIKDQFADLQETVIGAIKEMVIGTVVEAGIKWVLGLMNPASAFIKACMMIIDIVRFFIERGSQIIELAKAFIDGVAAVASGSVSAVANAIENALSRALPVIIGFLASLLGIGGLARKVQKIIKKIRKRIDAAINKIINKAKKAFRKLGGKIKSGVQKFVKWWKAKKRFKAKDGSSHSLFFKGEGNASVLIVASGNPKPFTSFISSVEVKTEKQKQAKTQAVSIAGQVDSKKREQIKGANETEKNKNSEKKQKDLNKLLGDLSLHAKELFGVTESELPETKKINQSGTKGGDTMGTYMETNPLTKKGSGGSIPTQRKHTVFDKLLKRRQGGSSYYIRGHLLNHNTHGPGSWENMTPLSKKGNSDHEGQVESKVKAAVSSGAIVKYTVRPVYGRVGLSTPDTADAKVKDIRQAEQFVPTALNCDAVILEKKNDGYIEKQKIVSKNVSNPVDTSLSSYQTDSVRKENVNLKTDTAFKIAANTDLSESEASQIKQAIAQIGNTNLREYNQLNEQIPALTNQVNHLKTSRNVTL